MKTKNKRTKQIWQQILMAAVCIIIPVAVGLVSAFITGDAMQKFGQFNQPPLAPPAWLFPVAWTILYILMGIGSYLLIMRKPKNKEEDKNTKIAIILYFIQLVFNLVWSPIFFLSEKYYFALIWLMIMWILILFMMIYAGKKSKVAPWLFVPYFVWCAFAIYLNFSIALLN